ncbi:MAG: cation:proton antiporter [Cyanobacteria bacterium P01_H01_bin.15]
MSAPYADWSVLAIFIFLYTLVSDRLERTWISEAIFFSLFGAIAGSSALGILSFNVTSEGLKTLVELTLALILFTDAATVDLGALKNSVRWPIRLLGLGLPLTILLGTAIAKVIFPEFSWVEAALLSTMLAPTDAALGEAVVTNPNVPDKIRADLNVESGLNDGICVPVLFCLLAIASPSNPDQSIGTLLFSLFSQQIGIGVLVGSSFAVIGSQLQKKMARGKWQTGAWQLVSVAALAIACFSTSQVLGGSGFIASFTGGLIFGNAANSVKDELLSSAEAAGDTLSLLTWVAFGSVGLGLITTDLTWQIVLYAALSLTIIRILPVVLCLFGTLLNLPSKLFMGWFGPRGLASIVFAVIVLDANLGASKPIVTTVIATIILSVIAHGLTANPLSKLYAKQQDNRSQDE